MAHYIAHKCTFNIYAFPLTDSSVSAWVEPFCALSDQLWWDVEPRSLRQAPARDRISPVLFFSLCSCVRMLRMENGDVDCSAVIMRVRYWREEMSHVSVAPESSVSLCRQQMVIISHFIFFFFHRDNLNSSSLFLWTSLTQKLLFLYLKLRFITLIAPLSNFKPPVKVFITLKPWFLNSKLLFLYLTPPALYLKTAVSNFKPWFRTSNPMVSNFTLP